MKMVILWTVVMMAATFRTEGGSRQPTTAATASWYGEAHRGRIMANGKRFDPDKLTAASWFYPLGTKVRVTLNFSQYRRRSVLVEITDRVPAFDLGGAGRGS